MLVEAADAGLDAEHIMTLLASHSTDAAGPLNVDEIVDGCNALLMACERGHLEIVHVLLAAGASVNISHGGLRPLTLASQEGHAEIATTLLAARASVNYDYQDSGYTALKMASQNGHTKTVKILLAAGARTDAVSPLMTASQNGHTDVVKSLLAAGAAVDRAAPNGCTALYSACQEGHAEVITALIAAGASLMAKNENGDIALHVACQEGHVEAVKIMLEANADVNFSGGNGCSPLYSACQGSRSGTSPGHIAIVKKLLASKAAVDQAMNEGPGVGCTPLFVATYQGHLEVVQLLLGYGASRIFSLFQDGNSTAETIATQNGQLHVKSWLQKTQDLTTPLHYLEFVPLARVYDLLRGGADVDARSDLMWPSPRPGRGGRGRGRGGLARGQSGLAASLVYGRTPRSVAQALREANKAGIGTTAHMVLQAAGPWSRQTHRYFPAVARARAVELMLIGELLSREERFAAYGPQAVVDAWMHLVVPKAVGRKCVKIVGIKVRPELNGQVGTIGMLDEAKARYPVHLESGESVLIKMMNLVILSD